MIVEYDVPDLLQPLLQQLPEGFELGTTIQHSLLQCRLARQHPQRHTTRARLIRIPMINLKKPRKKNEIELAITLRTQEEQNRVQSLSILSHSLSKMQYLLGMSDYNQTNFFVNITIFVMVRRFIQGRHAFLVVTTLIPI